MTTQPRPANRPEPATKPLTVENPNEIYSPKAEEAIIGSVLMAPDQLPFLTSVLPAAYFYQVKLRLIWESVLRLTTQGLGVNPVTLTEDLTTTQMLESIGGTVYLYQLMNCATEPERVRDYAAIVIGDALRRQGQRLARDLFMQMRDKSKPLPEIMVNLSQHFNAWRGAVPNRTTMTAATAIEVLQDRLNQVKPQPTVYSGLKDYDELVGGFVPNRLYLFGGDTGMGKSALLQNILLNNRHLRIAYFSTEMTQADIMARLLQLETGITQRMIREGLNPAQVQQARVAIQGLSKCQFYIDHDPEAALTPEKLQSRALQLQGEHGLDLIIVDHATDMRTTGMEKASADERQEYIAQSIKLMSTALNVPVLVAIQLNREIRNRRDKRPTLHDIRNSGRWEQLASNITFVYRDEVYNPETEAPNQAELIVAKARDDGRTGVAMVYCERERNAFINAAVRHIDLSPFNEVD